MLKYIMETKGLQITSQYGAYTLYAGLARLLANMCLHIRTRLGTHMQAHTPARAHGQISNRGRPRKLDHFINWTIAVESDREYLSAP
jgi:hypothetical protein